MPDGFQQASACADSGAVRADRSTGDTRMNRVQWMLAAALTWLSSAGPAFAGAQDFILVNKTGVEIHALFISPADKDDWGDDVLGQDTLPNGEEMEVNFSPKEKAAFWDIRVEDEDGGSIEWEKLCLTEIVKVALHFNKKTKEATAKVEKAESAPAPAAQGARLDFTLVNRTGVEIHALYISPAAKDDWGEDVLGEDTLPNGRELKIKFDRKAKAAVWDIRIEDEDGGSIEWEKLKLVEIAKVTLVFNKKSGEATAKIE
jgi:hypothetical protein